MGPAGEGTAGVQPHFFGGSPSMYPGTRVFCVRTRASIEGPKNSQKLFEEAPGESGQVVVLVESALDWPPQPPT